MGDFSASNFIQARVSVVTSHGESATVSVELDFQVDGDPRVTGRQYLVVQERGARRVCGPA